MVFRWRHQQLRESKAYARDTFHPLISAHSFHGRLTKTRVWVSTSLSWPRGRTPVSIIREQYQIFVDSHLTLFPQIWSRMCLTV